MKRSFYRKQTGVALFVALIILMVLTIIGLSAAQRSNLQEKMAANTHVNNMTFSAAESAIGAFMAEANTGNSLDDGIDSGDSAHVLFELRTSGTVVNKQYDNNGLRVASGYLDSTGSDGNLIATITPTILNDCDAACGGYSLGISSTAGGIGCRDFLLEGEGRLQSGSTNIRTEGTTLWAREITVCN